MALRRCVYLLEFFGPWVFRLNSFGHNIASKSVLGYPSHLGDLLL